MSDTPGWHKPDNEPDWSRHEPAPGAAPQHGTPQPPPPWASAKPGVIPLRPLGLGEILDGAVTTMRRYPALMIGFAAIVVAITQLIEFPLVWAMLDDLNRIMTLGEEATPEQALEMVGSTMTVGGLSVLLNLIATVFLTGVLTTVVGKAVLGRPTNFGEVWTSVKPLLPRLLGLTLMYPLVGIALFLPVFVVGVALPPLGVLLGIAAVVVAIWLFFLFALAAPALVLERTTVFAAFGRSRQLVQGSWWRIFGILLLIWLIVFAISLIVQIPFELIAGGSQLFSMEPEPITMMSMLISSIGTLVASAITMPFAVGAIALLYTDQRMRREGLDIELARTAGHEPPQS